MVGEAIEYELIYTNDYSSELYDFLTADYMNWLVASTIFITTITSAMLAWSLWEFSKYYVLTNRL